MSCARLGPAVSLLLVTRWTLVGDDMGLGKTVQVIGLVAATLGDRSKGSKAKDAVEYKPPEPVLIMVPASLTEQWKDEFATWLPEVVVRVSSGLLDGKRLLNRFVF